MEKSKHNIISEIADSDSYFIVNLLSQNADILTKKELDTFQNGYNEPGSVFEEKGYMVNPSEEASLYKKKYLEFIDTRDKDEIQVFFVPNYACNFKCSYCYQDEYAEKRISPNKSVIDAFFDYISKAFAARDKYITVFGGEPLLNTGTQRELIEYLIQKANSNKIELAFVTNGYYLEEYIPVLQKGRIREVQVTLDGTEEMHNKRRVLKGGADSFRKIISGIDLALSENLPVNLRMVLDKENIGELPKLARFAIDKGWTKHDHFKTQLGRNYELHHCQSGASRLYSRIGLYKDIYELLKANPYISEFHKPAFSVSKFLFEEGRLPDPLYDSCPGTKTEWAFDFSGNIYSCTATVGKSGEELGTFYPHVKLNDDLVWEWQDRDVLSIEECHNCEVRLACGGGCASVSKNKYGKVNSPDCRPVKELMGLGIAHYFEV